MINLNLNTRVYHKGSGEHGTIVGKNSNGDYCVIRDGRQTKETWYEHNTKPLSAAMTPDPLKKKGDRYSFHSSCIADVDFDLIIKDLSKKNSLALVEVGNKRYVIVHKTLRVKATICGIELEGSAFDKTKDVFLTEIQFSEWVKWAKRVKAAQWPSAIRKKTVVKVTYPKI